MKGLLATKIGMTQVFSADGTLIPVTVLHVEPNVVLAVRTKEKDGYEATQLGYKTVKEKNLSNAHKGQFKKVGATPMRHLSEIRDMKGVEPGSPVSVSIFKQGETVDVEGTTRGRGFTGAIRRWNMKIGPMSHGAGYPHRFQGSLGGGRGGSSAQHVFKGKHMSGHYGVENVTVENLVVIGVDEEKNVLLVKGAVPGPKRGLVRVLESQKKPNQVVPVKLVDTLLEARKNALLEEARHVGVTLDLEMKIADMQRTIAEAKAARDKEQAEKEAAEKAEAAAAEKRAEALEAAKREAEKAEASADETAKEAKEAVEHAEEPKADKGTKKGGQVNENKATETTEAAETTKATKATETAGATETAEATETASANKTTGVNEAKGTDESGSAKGTKNTKDTKDEGGESLEDNAKDPEKGAKE